jgi:hypothetical protein
MAKGWHDASGKPIKHHTWLHHDFKRRDPRIDEWVVECALCDFVVKGFTRKPDAKTAGIKHEQEANA